jgi:hypothetical protein
MNQINLFQSAITLGSYGVETIPSKTWREALTKNEPVQYRAEVRGNARVKMLDGTETLASVQSVVFDGRTPALFGAVEGYQYRASEGGLFTNARELADGTVEFDGPEAGCALKAVLSKGKTLRFHGAELKPVIKDGVQVMSAGKPVFEIHFHDSVECVDRPAQSDTTGEAKPIIAKGVARGPKSAAARQAQASHQAAIEQVL